MAEMSVLWSLVFLLGLGVFFPVEQELIRLVAARTAAGQGVLALARHRDQMLAWLAGVAVLATVTLIPGPVTLRVVTAYAAGSAAVALAMAAVLIMRWPGSGNQR